MSSYEVDWNDPKKEFEWSEPRPGKGISIVHSEIEWTEPKK